MRKISILALSLTVLSMVACSVKEERGGCPGWLHLELSPRSVTLVEGRSATVSVSHEGGSDTLSLSRDLPSIWIPVNRGVVEVKAVLDNGASDPSAWGIECDSLWAFYTRLSMEMEETSLDVTLHKRFATVWFSFEMAPDPEESCLQIRSVRDFRCLLYASDGEASVRLPASIGGASLELCCLSSDGNSVLWEWDLGAALLEAGYDWGAEDLSDARVRVSLAPLEVSVTVVPWEGNGGLILEI
ncbi:MAG: hypothetical protein II891_04385 [Bacteroidales bacterium]|nr:hypothetical protein [Bacteroidales bacterium]